MPGGARETATELGVASSKSILLEVMKLGSEASMIRMLERNRGARADARGNFAPRSGNDDPSRMSTRQTPTRPKRGGTGQEAGKKAHVFRFRSGDDRFSVSLSFRQEVVEENDLILALEGASGRASAGPGRAGNVGLGARRPPAGSLPRTVARAWLKSDNVHYVNSSKVAGQPPDESEWWLKPRCTDSSTATSSARRRDRSFSGSWCSRSWPSCRSSSSTRR